MTQEVPSNMHPIATAPENTWIYVSRPKGERGHEVTLDPVKKIGDQFFWADDDLMVGWHPTAWQLAAT